MPSPERRGLRLRRPVPEPSLRAFRARCPGLVPAIRSVRWCTWRLQPSCVGLLQCALRAFDLDQGCRTVRSRLAQQLERVRIAVLAERAAHHAPETFQAAESID